MCKHAFWILLMPFWSSEKADVDKGQTPSAHTQKKKPKNLSTEHTDQG